MLNFDHARKLPDMEHSDIVLERSTRIERKKKKKMNREKTHQIISNQPAPGFRAIAKIYP